MAVKHFNLLVDTTTISDPAALEIVGGVAQLIAIGGVYDGSQPYLETVTPFGAQQLTYTGFAADVDAAGGDAATFILSDDGGTTWYWATGGALVVSSGAVAESSSASDLNAVIRDLPATGQAFVWRAFFSTGDGSTTPTLGAAGTEDVTIEYSIFNFSDRLSDFLRNVRVRIKDQLPGLNVAIAQTVNDIPSEIEFPMVLIKDGTRRSLPVGNGWYEETVQVHAAIFVQLLYNSEGVLLGSGGYDGVLDLTDKVRTALLNFRFDQEGVIATADIPFESESEEASLGDAGPLVSYKVLTVEYERQIKP